MVFANDCLIFSKISSKATSSIMTLSKSFSTSGQKINFSKSSLYFSSSTTNSLKSNIITTLQIQHKTTIGKYLEFIL